MPEQSLLLWIICAVLTVTGLIGFCLPVLPGAPLIFLGLILGAWAENFRYLVFQSLFVLVGMAALTYLVKFSASVLGLGKLGGSRRAMSGAAFCG